MQTLRWALVMSRLKYEDLEMLVDRSDRAIIKGRDGEKLVIIKILDLATCYSMLREWRLAALYKLPHTLPVTRLDVGLSYGVLVFPYVEAGPCYPTSWQMWFQVLIQLFETLIPLHRNGYAHLDLNPSNILLETDGTIWVIDFGLASTEDDPNGDSHGWAGTLPYVDPMLIQSGQVTIKADLWSVGVMVARSIFKDEFFSKPYTKDSVLVEALALPKRIQEAIADPDLQHPHLYHPLLGELVSELLHPDPTQRLSATDAYAKFL